MLEFDSLCVGVVRISPNNYGQHRLIKPIELKVKEMRSTTSTGEKGTALKDLTPSGTLE